MRGRGTTAQRSLDLHRPAALRHHRLPRQSPRRHAGARPAVRRRRGLQPHLLPEPGVPAEPRQLPDRPLPQHRAREPQRQRLFPRQRTGAADHPPAGRRRLRLRSGRQAAPRLGLARGRSAHRRRLPGVPLQRVGHPVHRPRQRLQRLAATDRPAGRSAGHQRRGRGAQPRRPLPPGRARGAASDQLVRRPRHRLHARGARRPLADEREHLRSARPVRRAALLPPPLRGAGAAAGDLRRARRGDLRTAGRRVLPGPAAAAGRPATPAEGQLLRHDHADRRAGGTHAGRAGGDRSARRHGGDLHFRSRGDAGRPRLDREGMPLLRGRGAGTADRLMARRVRARAGGGRPSGTDRSGADPGRAGGSGAGVDPRALAGAGAYRRRGSCPSSALRALRVLRRPRHVPAAGAGAPHPVLGHHVPRRAPQAGQLPRPGVRRTVRPGARPA